MEFKNAPKAVNVEEGKRQQEYLNQLKELIAEKITETGKKPTCCVTTFGCQMNAKDSEKLVGILEEAGYEIIESEDADFVIYNTCTVRDNANQRVYGRLGQFCSVAKSAIIDTGLIVLTTLRPYSAGRSKRDGAQRQV